jgi:hypothetical protein
VQIGETVFRIVKIQRTDFGQNFVGARQILERFEYVIKSITNMGQVSVTTTEETQWQTE